MRKRAMCSARCSPASSCRLCPAFSIVACGWPVAPGIRGSCSPTPPVPVCSDCTLIHIGYGQKEGQPGVLDLRGAKLLPWLWDLECDMIQHEMASHGLHDTDVEAISTLPSDMDFGLGVANGKSIIAERPEWIADGVRKVLDVIPAERLALFTEHRAEGTP